MDRCLLGFPKSNYPRLSHFGFSDSPRRFDSGSHWHLCYEFVFFHRGKASITVKEGLEPVPLREDDMLVMPPGVIHTFATPAEPIRYTWVGFQLGTNVALKTDRLMYLPGENPRLVNDDSVEFHTEEDPQLESLSKNFTGLADVTVLRRFPEAAVPFRVIREEVLRSDAYAHQMIHIKMLELLTHLLRRMEKPERPGRDPIIQYLADYMDAHFEDRIDLDRLSRMSGLNASYLCRKFRQEIGTTPMKYLTQRRIERAKTLLAGGQGSTETAEGCGFSDLHYFCRVFKEYTGSPPGEYRRAAGGAGGAGIV